MIRQPALLFIFFVVVFPALVQGAEGQAQAGGSDFSFLSSFLQMIAALVLVVGLILLTYYLSTRLMRKIPALKPGNQHIRVIEVRALGPRKALVLVEVAGEYLLLASSGDHLNLVKQVPMLEEIEVIDEPPDRLSFFSLLKRATSRR
ncbi:MAG: flagellar biosynthetic protein FliO [Geobacteraceae bacterium]|nr:flagellar biosynthetic protein FliO [Geobacteraceae bacterium]